MLIDADPQGNATSGVGIDKEIELSVYDVLIDETKIEEAILKTNIKNLDVCPSNIDLAGAEVELVSMMSREQRLKEKLEKIKNKFDYIFIDCPPALGLLTLNGLAAADEIIVPMTAEFYALEGLSQLMTTMKAVRANLNPSLKIAGILFVMFDPRLNVSRQVEEEVAKYFPNQIFRTKIPRNVRLSEAPSYGKPVMYYDKNSKGAEAYAELGMELLGETPPPKEKKRFQLFHRKNKN